MTTVPPERAGRPAGPTPAVGGVEESFAAVFEVSPFAMALTEMPSGRITRVNRAFEQLFGFSREELVGRTGADLGISDPRSQEAAARLLEADGVVRDLEVPRTTHTGETRILSLDIDRITLGGRRSVLTSFRDVTEQRRAESALAASEKRYRDIVELTGDGIMIGGPDGTITFANRRMAAMLGYESDELVGMSGPDLIYPDWLPRVLDNRAALGRGDVVRGEFKLRRKDGAPVWTVFNSTPMFDEAGRHTGNLTMHTDITERKAAEEALRDSEERLNLALSAGGIGTWDNHIDDGEVVWNPEYYRLIGYEPGEAPACFESLLARVHPDDRERVSGVYGDALHAGGDFGVQFRALLPKGEVRWILAEGHVDRDPAGRPVRSYGVMLDVTGRVLAEEAERERATGEERSRLARDLHDSVTQALFAANLKAEALEGVTVAPEVEEVLREVRRLNRGALAQMRTMLLELRGEPVYDVPLQQLLRNVVAATESRTHTDVELQVEGDGELPPDVHVALYRIAQEALNNVARHARAKRAWVDLSLLPGAARLSVRDDGIGFEPGAAMPGHLGLKSMSERAAEAGARLSIDSAPGSGTSIVAEWPAAVDTPLP